MRLRFGMVGGGNGGNIGNSHRIGAQMDALAVLTAGCLTRNKEQNRIDCEAWGIPADRAYDDYREMAEKESKRDDGIDFVTVVTPDNSHYDIVKCFLEHGINVVCEKPFTRNIAQAEELAADAFGAAHAFLMVGGTTSSVQSMVLTACKRGDEIILPRNVHRSVLNALVLCGAVPVYVNPEVDKRLGISLGMKREQVAKAIKEHPNAVAVLVNNPTYYGICSDLRAIVKMAHDAGMLCLADEAHGTHFYFGGGLPVSAMAAGADMASVSMHKSGGSLTQSSLLLIGPNVHPGYVRQIINLTQTTSGSYLLMSSLDISRRNLALRGRQVFHQVADIAEYAREEINAVGGYYAFGKELCNGDSVFDFDTTKLSVHTLDIGLAGIEVYDILRDEYDIQIEFGDIGNILAYLSIGDRPQEVERLVSALAEIKRRYRTDGSGLLSQEYIDPVVAASPQEAFYAPKKSLPLRETEGMVCSEFVMCYPPGIPILAPGERITKEILNYIEYAKAKGCSMTGPEDPEILHLNVLA